MKKTFALHAPGKADARVVDAIKAEIRRYVKRERRKPTSEGVDFWEVDCAVGLDQATAAAKPLAEISKAIDELVATGTDAVFVQIVAKPGTHAPRKPRPSPTA